jgi:GNAT superfamily N-acetyltransferase
MIKEFQLEDAEKLAEMFNASDEGWPGGFTHGMPVTPEVVLDYKKNRDFVSSLIAWDRDKIVGIAELTEFWRDINVSYVEFINVIPTHHGKGYGRDLLKKCVQKSAELKYSRLDLHTWSGNMKAVPVYKKTGFFWVPKTLVHMKNFIPLILNIGAAKPYFEEHDWYRTFKREIKVEEDDFDGVFPYLWEDGGDMLSVEIDAESGGVTQFENNDFSISQRVGDAYAGRPVPVTWTFKNKTDAPVQGNVISRGENGISIKTRDSFILKGEREVTGEAFIDPKIEIRKKEEPPHVLRTDVVINGTALQLCSGLRVKHPVAVSTYPEYLFLPEGEQEILVVLKNNQKEKAEGIITCQNTGESMSFCIEPGHTEAVPFSITAEKDGELQFCIEDSPVLHIFPVRIADGSANVMQKGKKVILENAHSRIVVSLLGGDTSFFDKKTREFWAKEISDELGPPFWPSELFKTMYTVKTEQHAGKAVAEFCAESKKYNCRLIRRIEMDSTPVVKIQHTLVPQREVSLRFIGEGCLEGGLLTIPLAEGIVSEATMEDVFPLEDGDLPKDSSQYKEQWVCYEQEGSAFGVVWESCEEFEVRGYCLLNITMSGEKLQPIYLYLGSGTWRDVRALWSRIHKKTVPEEEPVGIWEVNPAVILTKDDILTQKLTLESHRSRPMKGSVNGNQFETKRGTPFIFDTVFDSLKRGVNTRFLHMKTDLFEKKIPISIVRAGSRGDITMHRNDIIEIDNGLNIVKVAPHFHGSVIFFGNDSNNVLTSYPEPTQFAWFRPWYGGIHPIVFTEERDFPGRMHKESFTYELVDTKKYGMPWKGVKVVSKLKEITGLQIETSYMTTAFSNLLVVTHSVINRSSAPFDLYTGVSFYLQPEGSFEDATAYYYTRDLQERRRTQFGGWARCYDWAAVKGGETVLTLVTDSLIVADLGTDGAHLFAVKKVEIPPHETVSSVSYFIAAHSLEQSLEYKMLRRVPWT